jgi:hypothetical protein
MIKDGAELLIALACMVALTIVVMLPIGMIMHGGPDSFWSAIPWGAILAAVCGFAFWLSWGGSRVFFRLVVVGFGVLFFCVALGAISQGHNEFFEFAAVTLGTAAVVALPRLVGVRRCRLGSDGLPPMARKIPQFSVLDIFVWTTTVALLAACMRWAEVPKRLKGFDELVRWSGLLGICTLLAMWATLSMSHRVVRRGVLAAAIAIGIGIFSGAERAEKTVAMVSAVAILIACFLLLRRRGVRLVRGQIRATEPADLKSPTTAASPFDAK